MFFDGQNTLLSGLIPVEACAGAVSTERTLLGVGRFVRAIR